MNSSTSLPAAAVAAPPRRTIAAFACVYFFWGSTYTAIHVAGLHLAPSLVAACRTVLTTLLLVVLCLATGRSLRVTRAELWRLSLVGILFMTVNSILLNWAETMVDSGVASLLVSTMPIMVAVIEAALPGGEGLNRRGWAGTLLGSAGMVALVWPSLRPSVRAGAPATDHHPLAYLLLLLAALAFAVGAVLSRKFQFKLDPFAATTWQIGAASLCNVVLASASGTLHTAVWTRGGVLAIVYLAIFGSLVGLSCLTYLLQHVAVTKVSTYGFVNPLVAVLLGTTLVGERLSPSELLGMAIIIAAVAMVIFSRVTRAPDTPDGAQPGALDESDLTTESPANSHSPS